MIEEFFKYLDEQIEIEELENWIYNQSNLEEVIGKENYEDLIGFSYNEKDSKYLLQSFIFKRLINQQDFTKWKTKSLLGEAQISFKDGQLFSKSISEPKFLNGKTLTFKQLKTKKVMKLVLSEEIVKFNRYRSNSIENNDNFLHLGTYEESYIHLLVNASDEIWIAYDVIDKQEFFAPSFFEALEKLVIGEENN